ncbi:DUF58 domain-containing protein [Virgibacillus salexigens]|uniref:DUF58 domain-containing protein n=1 Tax=Virgibacillus salexigens TaxID=61016 RepID=UPI00190B41CF|nr:DUF58 domain-containing protein [Virgibacillus salexigens]
MTSRFRVIASGIVVVSFFLLLFSYAMFQGGFVSWFLFFSFLPIFLYELGFLLHCMKTWKVSRQLSHYVIRAGDGIDVKLVIKRKLPFPLYYCICEEVVPETLRKIDTKHQKYSLMDDPGELYTNRNLKKVFFPLWKRTFTMTYRLEQLPRGEHLLQTVRIRTGDFFGLVKKEYTFHVTDVIIAYPNARPIVTKEQISSFQQGTASTSAFQLNNSNVATGIREYMPGDRFSWIDWKQTAKKNTVMTKEFEQEKSTDILLMLDNGIYPETNYVVYEAMVEVVLSLMEGLKKQASQVGLVTIGEKTVYFPVHHDPVKLDMVKNHLTRIQPDGIKPFSIRVESEFAKAGAGNVIILVTSHIDVAFIEIVKKMDQRTKRIVLILIQSAKHREKNRLFIHQLQFEGIHIHILTEQHLIQNQLEVKGI